MAKMNYKFDDSFFKFFDALSDEFNEVAEEMVTEGGKILLRNYKDELVRFKDTGDLLKSVDLRVYRRGSAALKHIAVVRPQKEDEKNTAKLWYIEFGTKKQPPRPFITRMTRQSRKEVMAKMQEVYDNYIERLKGKHGI